MKRIIARIFGLHTPEEVTLLNNMIKLKDESLKILDHAAKNLNARVHKLETAPPSPPPQWRPFHPEWLKSPEAELAGQTDAKPVRAIMQLLEDNITREVDDLTTQTGENLTRTAGALEALRNFHTEIASAVKV